MLFFPNAKINIGLNVVEKRPDGFHNIESIFYPVNELCDVLDIIESDQLKFTSTGIAIPGEGDQNLCVKAFELIRADHNIPKVSIHLHKIIPIGAGLGGGSADAAFTLKALNEMFELNLGDDQLIAYARKLGSDCAFFIKNEPVYAFNKGDEFEAIDLDLSQYTIKVSYPDIHISTREAYSGINPVASNQNLKELIQMSLAKWKEQLKNDFQPALINSHPKIKAEIDNMYANGAKFAAMTGSGSAVYGIF